MVRALELGNTLLPKSEIVCKELRRESSIESVAGQGKMRKAPRKVAVGSQTLRLAFFLSTSKKLDF